MKKEAIETAVTDGTKVATSELLSGMADGTIIAIALNYC